MIPYWLWIAEGVTEEWTENLFATSLAFGAPYWAFVYWTLKGVING